MNTPTTNYIEIDGEGKYIEDTDCREMAAQNTNAIQTINSKIPASASASNKMATAADVKTDTIQITKTQYYVSGNITVRTFGKLVQVTVQGLKTTTTGQDTEIATGLPEASLVAYQQVPNFGGQEMRLVCIGTSLLVSGGPAENAWGTIMYISK